MEEQKRLLLSIKNGIHQIISVLSVLLLIAACQPETSKDRGDRIRMDLSGQWQFALDTSDSGIREQWFLQELHEKVRLPGTTDENKKGFVNKDSTTMHLNRRYTYEGAAWYRKKILVPDHFEGKHLSLVFERSKPSTLWIDSTMVGGSMILQAPQEFDVSDHLSPGEHFITMRVNNDLNLTPYGNVHIYSDDTQTNWNGILGNMYLEASGLTYIDNLRVFPDIEGQKAEILLEIEDGLHIDSLSIEMQLKKIVNGEGVSIGSRTVQKAVKPTLGLTWEFDEQPALWDEYNQPLYQLSVVISDEEALDKRTVSFGMRNFSVKGTRFAINGRTTFLRGKHEAAVFPLTGHPPMTVDAWERVYRIAKQYGMNHYRFHTYCPPEAAFVAADREGIYLQAELPFWGGMDSDTVAQNQLAEGYAMLKAYANHPSFVMYSPGNEIWGGHEKVEEYMVKLKAYDGRPLYTMGSNNNIGYMAPAAYAEFFVGARVPESGNEIKGHTRLTHAYADADDGGILNTQLPSTDFDFKFAVSHMNIPLVSHEIGQYQIYPDYQEIDKYTGVLKAGNLEIFKDRLQQAGMLTLDSLFQKASGTWSAICYKAEMEAALRTPGMAGFQLLDLQDFPGQGTALVGILDAFMDSKGVVGAETWKASCNDVVLLLKFPKYVWTDEETFHGTLLVANYSNSILSKGLEWELVKPDGSMYQQGAFNDQELTYGGLHTIGDIKINLGKVEKAEKLALNVRMPDSSYANTYPLWVYPTKTRSGDKGDVLVSNDLDDQLLASLKNGASVLLFPDKKAVESVSVPGHFPPEFWNYGMFKGISESVNKPVSPGTLGILTDPSHPLFNAFPTDFHTNWQWFSILKSSNSYILDNTSHEYLPLVQVIDNLERNHKLGLIFEAKVGSGKILVCMSPLPDLKDRPEALQLYHSILKYMNSDDFSPEHELDPESLEGLN